MDITERKALEEQQRHRQQTDLVIREREHLARELHDSLGQRLSYLKLQAVAAREALARGAARTMPTCCSGGLTEVAQDTQTEVRLQIRSLFGDTVDGERFAAAMRAYATRSRTPTALRWTSTSRRTGRRSSWTTIRASSCSGSRRKHWSTSGAIRAQKATVALSTLDGHIRVQIEDNGRGSTWNRPSLHTDEHFGLRIMRQRARDIGAELRVDSAPGAGTRISISAAGRPAQWPETA